MTLHEVAQEDQIFRWISFTKLRDRAIKVFYVSREKLSQFRERFCFFPRLLSDQYIYMHPAAVVTIRCLNRINICTRYVRVTLSSFS